MSSFSMQQNIPTLDEFPLQVRYFLQVHKDGRCERFIGTKTSPSGVDPLTGVQSKDIFISPETSLNARVYTPKTIIAGRKIPILVYYHGGGFVVESPRSPTYHPTLNLITSESNVIIVSIDYRLAPEYPLPIGYNDSWEALKWVASHCKGGGLEPWLNNYGDFDKVFLAGDSAGANIAHNMAIRAGLEPVRGKNLEGVILLHPYIGGNDPIGFECDKLKQLKVCTDEFWMFANPLGSGLDDPLFNPEKNANLPDFGCSKILVCVAENDSFRDRGLHYKEVMGKSGWAGKLVILESKNENHVFFLFNTSCDNACALRKNISSFINGTPNASCM